uniref:Zinc finger protein 654 n=1 Tax=Latimeria chalumnae TaxID=7897 RepID=H3AIL1_LATCH
FWQVVEDYAGRWQVPLPQLQVLHTALCCFTKATAFFPGECEHVQNVLSRLALSFFELLLFFGKDEFFEAPLKDIVASVQECRTCLQSYQNVDLESVTEAIQSGGPWESPLLQAIMKKQLEDQEVVNEYLSSENPVFFEFRLRYLIACERIPEAMALSKYCVNHRDVGRNLYFLQAYLTCLFKSSLTDQLLVEIVQISRVDCRDAVEIICNVEREKNGLALFLCKAFLLQQLQRGEMYCIWDRMILWKECKVKSSRRKRQDLHSSVQMQRYCSIVKSIFTSCVFLQVGDEGLQFCVEICGCAIQMDLHDDPNTKCLIFKTIAYLLPNDFDICRTCALSVFCLDPSVDSYYTVERLYKLPEQDYVEHFGPVKNHIRFELLQILKRGLLFDPEFWNFTMIKRNCVMLLGDKAAAILLRDPAQEERPSPGDPPNLTNGEKPHACNSSTKIKSPDNSKNPTANIGEPKLDHANVPRHRCVLCNRNFLGGHIVRHAQTHQKKGIFSCVICTRKFRHRGLMIKHLKNHIRKMQRSQLAAQDTVKDSSQDLSNSCESCTPVENGASDGAADSAVVTPLESNSDQHNNLDHLSDCGESQNHIDNSIKPSENSNHSSTLNNVGSSFLHKVNGSLGSQKETDAIDQNVNFRCPAQGCWRVFRKKGFLNKHARKAHPSDLNVQEHIMKSNKGKCRFCQRIFSNSQHFIDHLNRHTYPKVYFCLHHNCNQKFKLVTELTDHIKSHETFQARCSFKGCCALFEKLPLLYEHEAQHYVDGASVVSVEGSKVNHLESKPEPKLVDLQSKNSTASEKEAVELPVPTWKAKKDLVEPKTYIQSADRKLNVTPNGSEDSPVSHVSSSVDQTIPNPQPESQDCSITGDHLVNGHSELIDSSVFDGASENSATAQVTENLTVSQTTDDLSDTDNVTLVSKKRPKPNPKEEVTSYGIIRKKPYVRPAPSTYLDERYISMPKRRKTSGNKVDITSVEDTNSKGAAKFRCGNCFTNYSNSQALEEHLAQKKCRTLFGFDSDDESAW